MGKTWGLLLKALVAVALLAGPVAAQEAGTATISGRVVATESSEPLPEARVIVIGTNLFAITGADGRFTLRNVPAGSQNIRVIRVGFTEQRRPVTVAAGQAATLEFELQPTVVRLSEVVTTATGETQRKRETGATIATIDSSQLALAAVPNLSAVLTARAPGVAVQSFTGTTGGSSRIRIRGSNSISLNNDPLLIIDGVRVDNSSASQSIGVGGQTTSRFNDINPEEIESIEIIKGPAAAAMYGTAAANGVIQIITRKGRSGRTRWEAFAEGGTLRDINEYPANYRAVGRTASGAITFNCSIDARARNICVGVDSLVRNAPLENSNPFITGNRRNAGLNVSGGTANTTFFLGSEIEQEQGIYEINHLRRLNLRSNVRAQLTPTLDATLSVGYLNSGLRKPQNDNNILGVVSGAMLGSAFDCGPRVNGNISYPTLCGTDTTSRGFVSGQVPQDIFAIDTREALRRTTASLTTNWAILPWLQATAILGGDLGNRDETETVPPNRVFFGSYPDGYRQINSANIYNYTANSSLTATRDISSLLQSTTTLGVQYNQEDFTRVDAFGARLLAGTSSLGGTNERFAINETSNRNRTLGFLGSQQVAYRDRLFVTGAVRTDRNSAFGQNFGNVFYPALNASWVVSEEEFFPQLAAISSFRLRAGYGASGQRPNFRDALQFYNPVAVTSGAANVPGFTIGNIGNVNLRPEYSAEIEGGFDLGLFDNRLGVEYSHYTKSTKDALVSVVLAPSLGSSNTQFRNLGRVKNWGDEIGLRAAVVDRDQIGLDLNANFTFTNNRLEELGVDAQGNPLPEIYAGFSSTQRIQKGFPLGAYFQRKYTYADLNNDGIISRVNCPGNPVVAGGPECEVTLDSDTSSAARLIGSPFAKTEINFTPVLRLFGEWLTVQALVDYRGGYHLYNNTADFRCTSSFQNCRDIADPENTPLELQARAIAALAYGTRAGYIEDASFTKLREVAATVRLPARFASRLQASSASFTLAGRNLKTWTDYTGLDPEVNSIGGGNFNAADFLTQPQIRSFTARLTLGF